MMFRIVEYTGSDNLSRPLTPHGIVKRELRTYEDGVAAIQSMLAGSEWKVRGYNEECDYYWARTKSPAPIRRILRVEPG